MVVATIVAVFLVAVRLVLPRHAGRLPLVVVLFFMPAAGVALSIYFGEPDVRTRVDVQFLGYRVPWESLDVCQPRPNPLSASGLWIGGGRRWEGDTEPDLITLPGYRGHLVELCRDAASSWTVRARVAEPGMSFEAVTGPNTQYRLVPDDGIFLQRVAMFGGDIGPVFRSDSQPASCFNDAHGHQVDSANVTEFVLGSWRADRKAQNRIWRRRLRESLDLNPPSGGDVVACVNTAAASPQRCQNGVTSPADMTFVWPDSSSWSGEFTWAANISGDGGWRACTGTAVFDPNDLAIPVESVDPAFNFEASTVNALPVLGLRMVTRRTIGGVADINVPLDSDRYSPGAFRLGPRHDIHFARIGNDLLLLVPEPSVQLRRDDLVRQQANPGEFEISFGRPTYDAQLVMDIASTTDQLRPKPRFEGLAARVRLDAPQPSSFSIAIPGLSPTSHPVNSVVALAVPPQRLGVDARPLVVVRVIETPAGLLLLPLTAGILVSIGFLFEFRRNPGVTSQRRWDVIGLALLLLTYRFVFTARDLVDHPAARDRVIDWLVTGAYFFVIPALVLAASSLTASPARAAGAPVAPLVARNRARSTPIPIDRAVWVIAAIAACAAWLAFGVNGSAANRVLDMRASTLALVAQIAAALLAVLGAYGLLRAVQMMLPRQLRGIGQMAAALGIHRHQRIQWRRAATTILLITFTWYAVAVAAVGLASILAVQELWSRATLFLYLPLISLILAFVGRVPVVNIGLYAGFLMLTVRFALLIVFGSQESLPGGLKVDVIYLPMAAGVLAALMMTSQPASAAKYQLGAILLFWFLAFFSAGVLFSDLGLMWVGAMAVIIVVPICAPRGLEPAACALALVMFGGLFMSPRASPEVLRLLLSLREGESAIDHPSGRITFPDAGQVNRDRDHYRIMETILPNVVEGIPSQLAREVVLERERVRYQALDGAWREGLGAPITDRSPLFGAGLLQARPLFGEPTFLDAARSDYVYPLFARAEFGTAGLLAILATYACLLAIPIVSWLKGPASWPPVGLWMAGLGVGSALFMLGGTTGLFAFSGKWPLMLAIGSGSDIALAMIVFVTASREV